MNMKYLKINLSIRFLELRKKNIERERERE